MKNKKKPIIVALCMLFVLTTTVVGAKAYLTDTESRKSTFKIGEMTATVVYNAGEGKFADDSKTNTVVYDIKTKAIKEGEIKTPELEGKEFNAWFKDEALKEKVSDATELLDKENPITLYAGYKDAQANPGQQSSGKKTAPKKKTDEKPAEEEQEKQDEEGSQDTTPQETEEQNPEPTEPVQDQQPEEQPAEQQSTEQQPTEQTLENPEETTPQESTPENTTQPDGQNTPSEDEGETQSSQEGE